MEQRIFLLSHAANLLLLVMVSILTLRFVQALDEAEALNLRLEERVGAREAELRARQAEVVRLEREQAGADERQRLMQDLHDGLGSQLFVTLSRVEQGRTTPQAVAQMLRDCIADMRLTFEVVTPEAPDLHSVLGNFRFRWETLLREAGLQTHWQLELPEDGAATLAPQPLMQALRVTQEALTNVLRHAGARRVDVRWRLDRTGLEVQVADDGRGFPSPPRVGGDGHGASDGATPRDTPVAQGGRGVSGMRQRAERLGGRLEMVSGVGGTRVTLRVPPSPAAD